jgi:hypothetical protein
VRSRLTQAEPLSTRDLAAPSRLTEPPLQICKNRSLESAGVENTELFADYSTALSEDWPHRRRILPDTSLQICRC